MRKALIGLILVTTAMTSVAAEAQRHGGRGGDRGSARVSNQNEGGDRASRWESRQERQAPQQQQQQQVQRQQPAPQPQVAQRRGGGDGNRGGNAGWQGRRNDGGNNQGGGNWRGRQGNNNNNQSVYPQAWQGNPNDPRLRRYQELERRNQQGGYDRRRDNDDRRDWRNDRNGRNEWRGDRNGRNWRNNWNRGWRNDNRYDWQRWRYSNRNIFRIGPYYSPYRDYRYSRFSIGFFLDSLFYDQQYWIGDPWQYRLPPAPAGTQWVRYYDDVLLVDIYTGEVVDAIYDFFW